nr:ATP-binding protein [Bacteroidota bacterium]
MGKSEKLFKIAITGPESTGKSLLAASLADHYRTVYVPEFARVYLLNLGRAYTYDDILDVARGQKKSEEALVPIAKKFIFSDTELLVTKIWCEFKYGKCHAWIEDQFYRQQYDLYLFTDIDLPWEFDPMREHPDHRKILFDMYRKELEKAGFNYRIVSGKDEERMNNAIDAINDIVNRD